MQGLHGFILNGTFLNLLDFHKKTCVKRKRSVKILLTSKKNPEIIYEYSEKKKLQSHWSRFRSFKT